MCTTSFILLALLAQSSPPTVDPQTKARAQGLLGEGTRLYQQGSHTPRGHRVIRCTRALRPS
jgi:hypothetical protein